MKNNTKYKYIAIAAAAVLVVGLIGVIALVSGRRSDSEPVSLVEQIPESGLSEMQTDSNSSEAGADDMFEEERMEGIETAVIGIDGEIIELEDNDNSTNGDTSKKNNVSASATGNKNGEATNAGTSSETTSAKADSTTQNSNSTGQTSVQAKEDGALPVQGGQSDSGNKTDSTGNKSDGDSSSGNKHETKPETKPETNPEVKPDEGSQTTPSDPLDYYDASEGKVYETERIKIK